MSTTSTVHTHQSQHFEDLQLSAKDFYKTLSDLIAEYKYPDVKCEPVTLSEGGFFSSRREYLRISKQRYHFYVCASPFGKSFFISWWLKEDANAGANVASKFGLLGRAVAAKLEVKSFYEQDTELMFTSSINSLIKAAIEKIKTDKGYRRDGAIVVN